MAEPWIRVHANIAEKRVVIRACDQLGVKENEAIGLLVRFWGAMSRLGNDGDVTSLTDSEIERWAGWRGKRGTFAKFVRQFHTDAEGRVNEWDEYQGALEHRRAVDRDRQRQRRERLRSSRGSSRDTSDGSHADGHDVRPRDVRDASAPARANETKRNEEPKIPSSSAPADSAVPAGPSIDKFGRDQANVLTLRSTLRSQAGLQAMGTLLERAASPDACKIALVSMLTGNDPATPMPTSAVFEHAVIDYAANGDRWNAALFRKYLLRASAAESEQWTPPSAAGSAAAGPTNGNGNGRGRKPDRFAGDRNDAALDAWLAKSGEDVTPVEITEDADDTGHTADDAQVHHGE